MDTGLFTRGAAGMADDRGESMVGHSKSNKVVGTASPQKASGINQSLHPRPLPLPQVQKHTERLQKEKEEAAMSQIKEELPSISPAVLALALQEAQWEVVPAIQLVQMFLNVRGIQLAELQKVRLLSVSHLVKGQCVVNEKAPNTLGTPRRLCKKNRC